MTKICKLCGIERPLTEYHRDAGFSCGHKARCKYCTADVRKAYYEKNRYKELSNNKKYLDTAPESVLSKRRANKLVSSRASYHADIEYQRERSRAYGLAHPEVGAASTARRRAKQRNATPSWANKAYIDLFYAMAKDESKRIGKPVHVDHIVPISSKLVCGLHCEDNLQLLVGLDNISKGNRHWPGMP